MINCGGSHPRQTHQFAQQRGLRAKTDERDATTIATKLHELAPRNYGLSTAQQLVNLAQPSVSSAVALSARSTSLEILCDQLEQTQANLIQLEKELENLMKTASGAKGEASRARIRRQDHCRSASGIGRCRSLCLLEPGGGLCGVG